MKKISKDKQDALILTIIGSIFYCVFALQFFVAGQKKRIENYQQEAGKLESNISGANRRTSRSQIITRDHEYSLSKLKELEKFMISGDPYAWMLSRTEEFKNRFKDTGLYFNVQRPSLDQTSIFPDFKYNVLRFKVYGKATFHDLGSFIASLEEANPFFRVEKLNMTQKNGVPPVSQQPLTESLDFSFDLVAMLSDSSS